MKLRLLVSIVLSFFCFGCVTDPPIETIDIDSKEVEAFLEGENPITCHAIGIVPGFYSALLLGMSGDVIISDVAGINLADIYTQNKSVRGLNLSCIAAKNDEMSGVNLVGIYSKSKELNLLSITGVASSTRRLHGVQISGLFSFVTRFKFSDVVWYSYRSEGVQIAGLANGANGFSGLQLGAVNLVKDDLSGLQLGAVNAAKNLTHGVQFGIVNINQERDEKVVDRVLVENERGDFEEKPVYGPTGYFSSWQFGLLNQTASGWWIPITNFGLF